MYTQHVAYMRSPSLLPKMFFFCKNLVNDLTVVINGKLILALLAVDLQKYACDIDL